MRIYWKSLLVACLAVVTASQAIAQTDPKPPLYWSTYEYNIIRQHFNVCYNYIPEYELQANIDWVNANLKQFGYQTVEIDGWGDTADQLHKMSVQQKWPEMAKLVTDEMVHAFAAVGTYDKIAGVIKKRFAGVNRLSFDMPVKNDHDRGVLKEIVQDLRRP